MPAYLLLPAGVFHCGRLKICPSSPPRQSRQEPPHRKRQHPLAYSYSSMQRLSMKAAITTMMITTTTIPPLPPSSASPRAYALSAPHLQHAAVVHEGDCSHHDDHSTTISPAVA